MRWLSDDAVAHLRDITEVPDLTGTRYRLVRELGRGGMGIIYEAEDRELTRSVALKVLPSEMSTGDAMDDAATRLRREARIVAALDHPGIVPVHDVGLLPDGRAYYVMKLVHGVALGEWAKGTHGRTERLRLFARICEPVAFAHASGVVHRDLKPENVMVGELGEVLVMDWGLARPQDDRNDDRVIAGTLGYMSPEQARGEDVDVRSDVFSLGVILSRLIDDAPRPLAAVIARARASDPAERYPDARALAAEIYRYLDGEPLLAYRESLAERIVRWVSRNRVLVALIAAYIVMRVIVFFWARL